MSRLRLVLKFLSLRFKQVLDRNLFPLLTTTCVHQTQEEQVMGNTESNTNKNISNNRSCIRSSSDTTNNSDKELRNSKQEATTLKVDPPNVQVEKENADPHQVCVVEKENSDPYHLHIQGRNVLLTYEQSIPRATVDLVVQTFFPFKQWVKHVYIIVEKLLTAEEMSEKEVASVLTVKSVHLQSVDVFGPKIGFIKFNADVNNMEKKFVPGITFMRGGSVSILVILKSEDDGKEYLQLLSFPYTILTVQPRVPIGTCGAIELPAGMLDGRGTFVGIAAKELREETGLEITEDTLICLSDLAFGEDAPGMFPSPGGCDEFIKLYLFRKKVSQDFINQLEGKATGVIEEGETITLKVALLEDLWRICPDGKSLSSLLLYSKLLSIKKVSEDF